MGGTRLDSIPARSARLMLGLFVFALGIVMTLRSELGVPPWDVLHSGLDLKTALTFGTATIVVGLVLIGASLAFGIRPGPGSVANMLFVGIFADLMLASRIGEDLGEAWIGWRLVVDLGGIALVGVATALYIGARMGAGPRDGLMLALTRRTHLRLGVVRGLIEGSALVIGALLGGAFGVGTALFALLIGPAVDLSFKLFGMDRSGTDEALGQTA